MINDSSLRFHPNFFCIFRTRGFSSTANPNAARKGRINERTEGNNRMRKHTNFKPTNRNPNRSHTRNRQSQISPGSMLIPPRYHNSFLRFVHKEIICNIPYHTENKRLFSKIVNMPIYLRIPFLPLPCYTFFVFVQILYI